MEDRILFDWFTFSYTGCPYSSSAGVDFVCSLLNITLDDFELINGFYGYKDRYYFSGISIHHNGRSDMGVCVEISGSGCRALENFYNIDWLKLFSFLLTDPFINITRLDIAYDSFNGLLPFDTILEHSLPNHLWFTSYWRKVNVCLSTSGSSVTFGSRCSDILLRIYDKQAESKTDFPWIRSEIQLRDSRAVSALSYIVNNDFSAGCLYSSIINEYIQFRIPSSTDSNKSRWVVCPFWSSFLSSAQKIKLFTRLDSDYDFSKLCKYVYNQSGHAIQTLLKIVGSDSFLNTLDSLSFSPNKRYDDIIKKSLAN